MGYDLRKPGILPVIHDDSTILLTSDGEGRQRQSLQQEAAVAGMKAQENESTSQYGDNRTTETHKKPSSPQATSLAQSTLLTTLLLAL